MVEDPTIRIVLEQLLADPEGMFLRGQVVDSGRPGVRRDCLHINVEGQAYFIKRYNCLGWRYRLRHLLRPSRALRSWRAGRALLQGGVLTAAPLLCLEERRFRLLGPAYLVCEGLEGAIQLLELWPQLDIDEQREALIGLADLLGRMHRRRIIHGDINWRNILVQNVAGKRTFYLVDLDGSRRVRHLKAARAERDIHHFIRDLRRSCGGEELESLFIKYWRDSSGLSSKAK